MLSPEFIAISKLSYPNVHRSYDFEDVLALNQAGRLQNPEYLSVLLEQTSISKLIDVQNVLSLNDRIDLQNLLDYVHRQLIHRFLHCDFVNVDALNPFQFFVLLDIEGEVLSISPETAQLMENIIAGVTVSSRKFQIAKLGLVFLVRGIPDREVYLLKNKAFQDLFQQALSLIPDQPSTWLSRTKNVLMTFRQLGVLQKLIGCRCDPIWQPNAIITIMRRILFDDISRLTLLTSVRSIQHDLKANRIQPRRGKALLYNLLFTLNPGGNFLA